MRHRQSAFRVLVVVVGVIALSLSLVAAGGAHRDTSNRSASTAAPHAPANSAFLVKRVTIAGTKYTVLNAFRAIRFVKSPYAKLFSYLVGACQAAGSFGFSDGNDVGIVAYVPTNPADCFPVSGGGPSGGGPSSTEPCAQFYRTVTRRYWVMIVGTDTPICADISTQVPGSVRGTTTDVSDGGVFAAGTAVWVTCQEYDAQQDVLWDYVEPRGASSTLSFPRPTNADWIDDQAVDTGYVDVIPNIPRCSGVNTAF